MLTQMQKLLYNAYSGYAAPTAVAYSTDSIKWGLAAAAKMRSPIVIGIASGVEVQEAAELTRFFAGRYAQAPSALSLEDCAGFEAAVQAVMCGYSNVVLDARQDAALLREAAHMAHSMGAGVECRMDVSDELFSDTGRLAEFVRETRIDGLYLTDKAAETPNEAADILRTKAIAEMEAQLNLPLSLDGDVYFNMERLSYVARTAAARVCLRTVLSGAAVEAARECVSHPETDRRGLTKLQAAVCDGYEEKLAEYIRVVNAHNRW